MARYIRGKNKDHPHFRRTASTCKMVSALPKTAILTDNMVLPASAKLKENMRALPVEGKSRKPNTLMVYWRNNSVKHSRKRHVSKVLQ